MLKSELVARLSKKMKVTEDQAKSLLHHVVNAIVEGCSEDGIVIIRGFGTFKKSKRKARTGTNPSTGERIHYPESKMITFKAVKTIRSRLK